VGKSHYTYISFLYKTKKVMIEGSTMSKNGFVVTTKPPKIKQSKLVKTDYPILDITSENNPKAPQITAKMVSDTPGRLRLRLGNKHRQAEEMQGVANTLQLHPNIKQVRTNVSQGSITILHEGENSLENVNTALQDVGIIFGDIGEGKSEVAHGVASSVIGLNKRVRQSTDGIVDLRFLFPLGLGCLSIRKLMLQGLQLDIIPWYVLAWYSFDSFLKLHASSLAPKEE
jgi:Heavy metal associated domain 2